MWGLAMALGLIFVAWGLGAFDKKAKPKPKVKFLGFDAQGDWCVPTRYAAAHSKGLMGDATEDVFSATRTNPKFSISSSSSETVQWYRAVAPRFVWEEHVMTRLADGTFVDQRNPCPASVAVKFEKFDLAARSNTSGWCNSTTYRAVYGSRSSTVQVAANPTRINPVLSVTPDIPVEWFRFRQLGDGDEGDWVPHSMRRVGSGPAGLYVDELNTCGSTPQPQPGLAPTLESQGFLAPSTSDMPWLVPTRYRAAFKVDNGFGPLSPASADIFSATDSQPAFKVLNNKPGMVQWYRAVAPEFEWKEHEMEYDADGIYSDLQLVPIPTPPAPVGNGLYDNKWNDVAGDQLVPWRLASQYRVRYVHENYGGDWSEWSEEYQSEEYTTPSLKTVALDPFQIEWEASGSYITLPMGDNNGVQTFKLTTDDLTHFGISLSFGQYGTPSGDLVMQAANFVNTWNTLQLTNPNPWPMDLLLDEKLQLTVVNSSKEPGTEFWLLNEDESDNQWWPLLGFNQAGNLIASPITAEESVVVPGTISVIGGASFVDE